MTVPASVEAEKSVLGAILLGDQVPTVLSPEDFYDEMNREIFRRMQYLSAKNIPIDPVSIGDPRMLPYLSDLTSGVMGKASVQNHVRIIKAKSQLRQAIAIANRVITKATEDDASVLDLAQELESSVAALAQKSNSGRNLLLNAARFCATMPTDIEWLIEGIIPVGSNGIISGEPKASKSWISDEVCLSLASGESFLGFDVPRAIRVALFAREDYPGLTSWRLSALFRSRTWRNPNFFSENLLINTRAQSEQLLIDNAQHVEDIIHAIRQNKIQFAMFDVLNILHESDENDNTEMRKVMNKFSYIQGKTGCSIGVVHHLGKVDGKWVRRLRGASSIHGWVEWLIGVTEVDPETRIRKMEFELKAGEAPDPVFYRIESDKSTAKIIRCEGPAVTVQTKRI